MRRYILILDFTLKSLMRRKGKNLGIVLLFSLLVFLFASVLLLIGSMKKEAKRAIAAIPDITVQKLIAGRQVPIPVSYAGRIKKILGIKEVIPRSWGYYFDASTQSNYTIIGYGAQRKMWEREFGLNGSDRELPERLVSGTALVGEGIMRIKHLRPGSRFILVDSNRRLKPFRVAGAFKAATDLYTHDIIIMPEEDAMEILGLKPGAAMDLGVYAYNPNEVTTIAKKISVIFPSVRVVMKKQLYRSYDTVYSWKSGVVLMTLLGSLFAFIILVWDKASGLSAEEKREIGILKAIGWETSDILVMKFWEGASIAVVSFLAGTILAYLHIFVLDAALIKRVIIGWSVLYPPFKLTPDLDLNQMFPLFFLAVIPYVLSTIVPSWKAAVIDPDSVMRGL